MKVSFTVSVNSYFQHSGENRLKLCSSDVINCIDVHTVSIHMYVGTYILKVCVVVRRKIQRRVSACVVLVYKGLMEGEELEFIMLCCSFIINIEHSADVLKFV